LKLKFELIAMSRFWRTSVAQHRPAEHSARTRTASLIQYQPAVVSVAMERSASASATPLRSRLQLTFTRSLLLFQKTEALPQPSFDPKSHPELFVFADLLGQIALVAHFFDLMHLRLKPVQMHFLVFQ
jgi:hypothetical protein